LRHSPKKYAPKYDKAIEWLKGALWQDTARLMVFKLVMAASKTWRRLQGQNQLPKVHPGCQNDGIEVAPEAKSAA
jgi:putative transposase